MPIDPLSASKAYLEAAKAAQSAKGAGMEGGDAVGQPDFGAFLQDALKGAQTQMKTAETQSLAAAAAGKADIVNVVTAIAQAENTLETVVAVRDQVISAYQEILRMPI
jgi:flagellar hook-basal body complex protein FliE